MNIDLGLILQFCLIIFILALTVAAVMFILIMLDIKQITKRIKKELNAVAFLFDIIDFIISSIQMAGKKIGNTKIARNIKKTLNIIKKEDE